MISPHADPTLDEEPTDKYQAKLETLYTHMKNSVQRLQIKVAERLNLEEMIGDCLTAKCD